MYESFKITPPFFEIGPKAYIFGRESLMLAKKADELVEKYGVKIIYTPQYVDIPVISAETKNIFVFAQHMDSLEIGRGIGSVLPEAIRAAGAKGVLLNHAEKRLPLGILNKTIKRADELGLATLVCADTPEEAFAIAHLSPNIIIAESPELIEGGKRGAEEKKVIQRINSTIQKINKDIHVLHGAGINNSQDVYEIIRLGAEATGSTSAIIKAKDPFFMLEEMIQSVRKAWDECQFNY